MTEAAGYVNYYIREGERVAVGDTVYTLDESGRISEILFSDTNSNLKNAIILTNRNNFFSGRGGSNRSSSGSCQRKKPPYQKILHLKILQKTSS